MNYSNCSMLNYKNPNWDAPTNYEWHGMHVPREWQRPYVNKLWRPNWMHVDADMIIDNFQLYNFDNSDPDDENYPTYSKEI